MQVFVFLECKEVFEDFFVGDYFGDDCYQYEYCVEVYEVVCLQYWDVVQVKVQVVEKVVFVGFVCGYFLIIVGVYCGVVEMFVVVVVVFFVFGWWFDY